MTKLTASHASAEAVIADADAVVLEGVGEIVVPLCHGSDENADALPRAQVADVVGNAHDLGIEAERDLAAVRW